MVVLTYRISLPDTERHHETKTTKSNMANLFKNDVKAIESGSLRPMFTINTKDWIKDGGVVVLGWGGGKRLC